VEVKSVNVKLRITEELWLALQRLADNAERSVAGEMRMALRAHVEACDGLTGVNIETVEVPQ